MRVAVITARGGSKRVPRKNVLEFHGKPMIAWSIEAAKRTGLFDNIIVSTDDAEIEHISINYGAEVPFQRPELLSDDFSTTGDVMAHATNWLESAFTSIDAICCIYPTAPFITPQDILAGYKALDSGNWLYSFSATTFDTSVYRAFTQDSDGGVKMIFPEYYLNRSQDLPSSLHDAAQFYWGRPAAWKRKKAIFSDYSIPIEVPSWRVVDIDTYEHLWKAKILAPEIYRRLAI